jgi:hypothetical protein
MVCPTVLAHDSCGRFASVGGPLKSGFCIRERYFKGMCCGFEGS